MEMKQEREWAEAQKIEFSIDLVDAAKKQLEFLAAVDRTQYLYEGPALKRAIFRYNAYWLPLLAKHTENPLSEDALVVPLDCEWIWHCHRLNPIRYKFDCEKLYGRILGNDNVISSVQGTPKNKTEEIWKIMYPEEPYELELKGRISENIFPGISQYETFTDYDLVSAVERQTPFFFQVSRPHMSCDIFLQEAVARYKGFLHLIRINRNKSTRCFCVPTYDVDLIWHAHQIHPTSYCEDLYKIVGEMVGHDDSDTDRTKGNKMETGFSDTTKQWEETFGLRYWKAGAMFRVATPPISLTHVPFQYNSEGKKFDPTTKCDNLTRSSVVQVMEVLLEFVEIKNVPNADKGNLVISFSKNQPDKIFNNKRTLSIFSEAGEKQVALFECEPEGEFVFELVSELPSNTPETKSVKLLGSCSLSLQELLAEKAKLSLDKWLSVVPATDTDTGFRPDLHVSISFTTPRPTSVNSGAIDHGNSENKMGGNYRIIESARCKASAVCRTCYHCIRVTANICTKSNMEEKEETNKGVIASGGVACVKKGGACGTGGTCSGGGCGGGCTVKREFSGGIACVKKGGACGTGGTCSGGGCGGGCTVKREFFGTGSNSSNVGSGLKSGLSTAIAGVV